MHSIIGLARNLRMQTVAEGVETEEQGLAVLQMGCHHAQGYCIAMPMPVEQFMDWAKAWQAPAPWRATSQAAAPVPPAAAIAA